MAIGHAVITGDDATAYQGDKPTLFGVRRLSAARWNSNGLIGTADETDSDYPATNAFDGHMGAVTKPDAATRSTWYFVGTLDVTTVDCIFLNIHDADGAAVTVYLGDTAPTNHAITTITSTFFATAKRRFCAKLQISGDSGDTQRRFTGVAYVIVKFVKGSNCAPSISEIAAGRQRPLDYEPRRPYDDNAYEALHDRFESRNGITTKYKNASKRKIVNAEYLCNSAEMAAKFTDWYDDVDGGIYPWVWCPKPKSAPNTAWLMNSESKIAIPNTGPIAREIPLIGIEQGGSLLVNE